MGWERGHRLPRTALGAGLLVLLSAACSENGGGPTPPSDGSVPDQGGSGDGKPSLSDGKPKSDGAAPDLKPLIDSKPLPDGGGGVIVPSTWVSIKAGSFTMGSPTSETCRETDETAHSVTLTNAFQIADKEVTQKQFKSLMGYNPSFHASCGDSCPVEWVSWHEAAAFCNRLSQLTSKGTCYTCTGGKSSVTCTPTATSLYSCKGYRLPTEAEWEHAARAGTTGAFPNGDISSCMSTDTNAGLVAWYKANSNGTPHPVGQKSANPWLLYDMSGNVYEWTNDWYQQSLGSTSVQNPTGPTSGSEKVFRGGSWYHNAEHARSAARERFTPTKRFTFLGFRCVISQ